MVLLTVAKQALSLSGTANECSRNVAHLGYSRASAPFENQNEPLL